jgi:hypothetical protein
MATYSNYDNFSSDTSQNYESDYRVYSGTGTPAITTSIDNGRLKVSNQGQDSYNNSLTRQKTNYIIPAGTDFDFSIEANRTGGDSFNVGIGLWSDSNRTKWMDVFYGDFQDKSVVQTHAVNYVISSANPATPFNVRVSRIDGIYTCWLGGVQLYSGTIPELDGLDLRYGVIGTVSSGPNRLAVAYYDNWSITIDLPCSCGNWLPGECTDLTHRNYSRSCLPSGCDAEIQNVGDMTCTPQCSCSEWQSGNCVNDDQREQIRTCTPDGCENETQITDDATCAGVPPEETKFPIAVPLIAGALILAAVLMPRRK